jgi:hypothetical protein
MNLSETFDRLGANEIGEFIQLGQEEHLHLDFKTVNSANLRNSDDKRNLAKCLSGFANSSGGIMVWGVDARKNAQGIDCASATVEIAPIRLFVARLNELTGEAASPIVEGVRHKSIAVTRDSGFAATLVPESDSGPHMAKLGEDRYYKRSGDSFYRMEHFDLEDMFGRRQKPRLSIILDSRPSGNDSTIQALHFSFRNSGRAVAKHTGFIVRLQNAEITMTGGNVQNVSGLNAGVPTIGHNNDIGVVHPNRIPMHIGIIWVRRPIPDKNIIANVTFFCDGARSEAVSVEVPSPHRILPGWIVGEIWNQQHGAIFEFPA